jgi:hypothetical protein
MKHYYYFPWVLALQRAWALNYKENLPTVGATLGMSPEQITEEQDFCKRIIDVIDAAVLAMSKAKQANKDKNDSITEVMKTMQLNIRSHKAHTGYNEGIGELLGIIGEERTFDPSNVKTIVKLKNTNTGVEISFTLEGCEGGNVYSKRGNEESFTFFKHLRHPHSYDTRPNLEGKDSEQRQYYVNLCLDDEEVGQKSDIASISV